jgi:hypothetical protein
MTKEELDRIREIHDKLDALEAAGKYDEADAFYGKHRGAFNFTRNGGWIGPVRNEDGWTP